MVGKHPVEMSAAGSTPVGVANGNRREYLNLLLVQTLSGVLLFISR